MNDKVRLLATTVTTILKVAELAMPSTRISLEERAMKEQEGLPGSYARLFGSVFTGQEQLGNMFPAHPLRM